MNVEFDAISSCNYKLDEREKRDKGIESLGCHAVTESDQEALMITWVLLHVADDASQ